MRAAAALSAVGLTVALALAACVLNPQPLPPDQPDAGPSGPFNTKTDAASLGSDSGRSTDAGRRRDGAIPPAPPEDGGLDSSDEDHGETGQDAPADVFDGDAVMPEAAPDSPPDDSPAGDP
jgi:hypothetical protein